MSIRLRLTLYWAAVLAGILIVAAVAVLTLFEREQWGALEAALLEEADTAAEEIARNGLDVAPALVRDLSLERDLGPRRRVRLVAGGQVVADYGDTNVPLPALDTSFNTHRTIRAPEAGFAFAVVPFLLRGRKCFLIDGADVRALQNTIARLRNILILLVPALLALCVAGGYWLAGRGLAPMASLAAALDDIQPSDLSARLEMPGTADEVARLSEVINALLDRVERASATERRFASDAAHELRTPLAVLRTGLEVALRRERSADEARTALEHAHQEVIDLCKIADDLLVMARLGGEATVDRKPLDLGALVDEVDTTVEPVAQARNVVLRSQCAPGAIVNGNASHLRRLVINLLDNALKYTPEGGAIDVRLRRDGDSTHLIVADSGPGIDPADLPRIFDRFYRGAAARGEGSGLGLSLCREIARLHGGEITAANRPGGGAAFTVTLPLAGIARRTAALP
jgi:heavy metal sensor kinase